jgi:predicted kinase
MLDACHLSTRARWHSLQGPNGGHRKVCTVFDLPLEAILARCRRTARVVPSEVARMWQAFQASRPTADELERLGFDEMHLVRQGGRRRGRLGRKPGRRAAGERRVGEVAAG